MRSAGVIGRSPRHGRPPLGFVTLDGAFVTGFSAGGVMVRVPLMTSIGHGGGSSCSLSSRSQAAQCNIHQAFIIALLARLCFHDAAFITITIGYVDILMFRMNRPNQDEYTLPALLIALCLHPFSPSLPIRCDHQGSKAFCA